MRTQCVPVRWFVVLLGLVAIVPAFGEPAPPTVLPATCSTTCPPIPASYGKGVECQASQSATEPFSVPCETECNFSASVYGGVGDEAPQPISKPGWVMCSHRCAPWAGRYTVCKADSTAFFAADRVEGIDFISADCTGGCEYPTSAP